MPQDGKILKGAVNAIKQEKKGKLGPVEGDEMLKNIYKNFPAFKNMRDVVVKADTSFTREKTGAGDIEYFSPDQDTVTYDTGFKYPHPQKGSHGIVYNPKDNDEQSVMLDMLHGMRTDSTYNKHTEEFTKAFDSKFGDDIIGEWERYNEETKGENDGFEQFKKNYIDGTLRNLMFQGTDADFEKSRYWKDARKVYLQDPDIKDKFFKIENYLKTNKK
jgi:hypothetical protein